MNSLRGKLFVRSEGESARLFVNPCLSLVKKIETVLWFDSGESGEGWNFVISALLNAEDSDASHDVTQVCFSFQSTDSSQET